MSYHLVTPKRRRSAGGAAGSPGFREYAGAMAGAFAGAAGRSLINAAGGMGAEAGSMLRSAGHSVTNAVRNAAERMATGMAGGAAMDVGENSVVPAQLIPGRGAELSFQQLNVLGPIKFKTGEPAGPKLTDAHGREKLLYSGQSAMHAFAYKMQLKDPGPNYNDAPPETRFVVHNVFRHVLQGVNNTGGFAGADGDKPYGVLTQSWNETLGPDKSYVRKLGTLISSGAASGSAISVPPTTSGLVTSFQSPFRYPRNGAFMFARMTRQLLENLGWNANPMKMQCIAPAVTAGAGVTFPVPLLVYEQAYLAQGTSIVSAPNQLPLDSTEPFHRGQSFGYKNQTSRGQLSYNFNNDGTNPVVVDIVITRVKKNQSIIRKDIDTMVECYQTGYLNYSLTNRNQADLQGQTPNSTDVTTNARGPFLPAKALDNYRLTTPGGGTTFTNQSSQPWKQVARDQFIISAGSTRNWSMGLQSMDYFANKYAQFQAPIPTAGVAIAGYDNESNCLDDLSYIVSIAISGVPAPYVEYNTGTNFPLATIPLASVVDRRGTGASVSVVGAYKEVCHPVYLAKVHTDAFINGRLDIPRWDFPNLPVDQPQLSTNDIANIGQAVRGPTTQSALIGMGPFNTVGGG